MKNFLLSIIMATFLVANLFGQTNLSVEKQIPTVRANKFKLQEVVLPSSLNDTISKLLITKGNQKSYKFQTVRLKKIFLKYTLFRVTEYFESGVVKNKDGTFTSRMQSHPAWYPSVLHNKKLCVFSESNVETDTEIFNLFLKQAKLKIENEQEALELANLYFSVTRGYFENRGKLILSKLEDVPLSYRTSKEAETKRLREIVVSPMSKTADGSYEVELYTWEIALGEVRKWTFKIQENAQIEVKSEVVGKL
jgi:hypothetical protein